MADELSYTPYDVVNLSHKQRINKSVFGDGYTQRQPKTINNARQKWSLNLAAQNDITITTMEQFFESRIGQSFTWTPPDGVQRKFVCRGWDRKYDHYLSAQTLTATLEEVYE